MLPSDDEMNACRAAGTAFCIQDQVIMLEMQTYRRAVVTHQLGVKVPHAQHSAGHFSDHSKRLNQQVIKSCTSSQAAPELISLGFKLVVCELLHLRFLVIDLFDQLNVPARQGQLQGILRSTCESIP